MPQIIVTGCNNCPFANDDNELGRNECHLDEAVVLCTDRYGFSIVPHRDPYWKPANCPLLNSPVTVSLP